MKRLLVLFAVALIAVPLYSAQRKMIPRYNTITNSWASYPLVSIHDIQFVSPESLQVAESVQAAGQVPTNSRWSAQQAGHYNDTVVIVAAVIAPYFTITYTQHGWTMLLRDTAKGANPWNSAIARVGNTVGPCPDSILSCPDTVQAAADGFKSVERGDVIMMTARVEEFPTGSMNSATQLHPIPGIPIDIISSGTYVFPAPALIAASDLYQSAYITTPPYYVNYLAGEKWEGCYVKLTNLTVTSPVNLSRGTWNMTDQFGNQVSDYDASFNFTFHSDETPQTVPDTSITHFHLPPTGAVIDSIKGFITVASGGENTRGYRIAPLFIGDVKYGTSKPNLFAHRRYPVIVSSLDSVAVQARAVKIAGGLNIGSVHLFYSTNGGPWVDHTMTLFSDTALYQGYIFDPDGNPFPAGTSVRYFVKAYDVGSSSNILANSSSTVANDTSQGFFFYTVLDRPLTIRDVQYTPYPNGRSGFLGGVTRVSGIVTADTTDVVLTPTGTFGTTAWYIQNGSGPWNGIWVVKDSTTPAATVTALEAMRRGDSITVTGTIQEQFDVTRIRDSLVTIHASGRPLPAPVTLATGSLNEQYESILVRFVNTTVMDTGVTFGDDYEYSVDDGAGQLIVRRDGLNSYSNLDADTLTGKKILHVEDKMDTIIGIGYFSHSRWKVVPRKDADIFAGDPNKYTANWNLVGVGRAQHPAATAYGKSVLYPGSSSNAFYYNGAYVSTTLIQHRKGYWIKFPSARIIRQLGKKRTNETINVVTGWNLIAGLGNPVPTNTITTYPAGNHLSNFYEYKGIYQIQDSILPGKGLWVKASADGYFVLSASMNVPKGGSSATSIKQNFNTLTISDNADHRQMLYFGEDTEGKLFLPDFEMPPPSPESDGFDVRYASGRILEAYPKGIKEAMDYGISVDVERGPVTVSWNIVTADGKRFILSDAENGKSLKGKELAGSGSLIIGKSGSLRLNLNVNGGPAVPKAYALGQNYPNPFNPSTKFVIALPQTSHLEVVIYNILGQKVAAVADELREAGYHTLVWDGNTQTGVPAASGIYFVRMNAEKFSAVRKMMLLK